MSREINVNASDRLDLQGSADAIVGHYHAILAEAFEQRQREVGGEAVMFDTVLEIAQGHGFPDGRFAAERILQAQGQFVVEPGPGGRLVVRKAAGAP